MLQDVDKIFEALHLRENEIIVFGRSIGSIFAVQFAYKHPNIAGLIIDSGLAEPLDLLLNRQNFVTKIEAEGIKIDDLKDAAAVYLNNKDKLNIYRGALLILHTQNDEIVPVDNGKRLYAWASTASEDKKLVIFETGSHNYIWPLNNKEYCKELTEFFLKLDPNLINNNKAKKYFRI